MRVTVLIFILAWTACSTPRLADKDLPAAPESLRAAFDGMPAPASARLRILSDNVDAWSARWRAIEQAQRSIDVQYFIIEPDAFGFSLLGLLYEKQRAGVKVRLMVDSRGTFAITRPFFGLDLLGQLAAVGAEVRIYNPVEMQIADTLASGDLRKMVASNHDKLLIVDRRLAITGGRNISKDYLVDPKDHATAYTDTDVMIEGTAAARALTEAFATELKAKSARRARAAWSDESHDALLGSARAMRLWTADPSFTASELSAMGDEAKRKQVAVIYEGRAVSSLAGIPSAAARSVIKAVAGQLADLPRSRGALTLVVPPMSSQPSELRVLDTHSAEGATTRNRVNENLMVAVQGAKREVIIQSPYFVLTERALRTLELASQRGVRITILTNSPVSSDSPITQAAFLRQWPTILARMPTARLFVVSATRLMHAKVGIIDGMLTFVGSYNLDPLSAGVNGEVLTAIWDRGFAEAQRALILNAIDAGKPDIIEYRIQRQPGGNAVLLKGEPVVLTGPDDHCDAAQLEKVRRFDPWLDLFAPLI